MRTNFRHVTCANVICATGATLVMGGGSISTAAAQSYITTEPVETRTIVREPSTSRRRSDHGLSHHRAARLRQTADRQGARRHRDDGRGAPMRDRDGRSIRRVRDQER